MIPRPTKRCMNEGEKWMHPGIVQGRRRPAHPTHPEESRCVRDCLPACWSRSSKFT
jgi:hypothetical protein